MMHHQRSEAATDEAAAKLLKPTDPTPLIDYVDQNFRTMGESTIEWTE